VTFLTAHVPVVTAGKPVRAAGCRRAQVLTCARRHPTARTGFQRTMCTYESREYCRIRAL